MQNIWKTLHHLCLVVHDANKTAAYYESIGVGPWQDYPPLSAYAELDVPNRAAFQGLVFKFVNLGTIQLQLCQPSQDDGPQRRFLDQAWRRRLPSRLRRRRL